jgi:hypothetical protein
MSAKREGFGTRGSLGLTCIRRRFIIFAFVFGTLSLPSAKRLRNFDRRLRTVDGPRLINSAISTKIGATERSRLLTFKENPCA